MNLDIAIVAMECKVPGAVDLEQFWDMIVEGKDGIRHLSKDDQPEHLLRQKNYVAIGGFVEDIDLFDCEAFDISAREAAFMDPQHRQFLMLCAQVLEKSGNASGFDNNTGVFASIGFNSYYNKHLASRDLSGENTQSILLGNVHDCVATRVAYNLNLTGPAMSVQCGCSSTLVAIHQARVALLAKQCDSALVGGAALIIPQKQGYSFVEGGVTSPNGRCSPLSSNANGTIFTSGAAVVLLKRLADAQRDGDKIYAVIKGSAINNDGDDKASFTAPSVGGQQNVIKKALRVAKVDASSVDYVECHGTGTPIGDPIELSALKSAFNISSAKSCALGSLKANLGHMDVVSGIAGLMKVSLMLDRNTIPVQINCATPCGELGQAHSPFYVNNQSSQPWNNRFSRTAGVSSFGFGGTNAHVVLQGAETSGNSSVAEGTEVLPIIPISAKTESRMTAWLKTLRSHLQQQLTDNPQLTLDQVAYTLQTGYQQHQVRLMLQPKSLVDLVQILDRAMPEDYAHCKNVIIRPDINTTEVFELRKQWLGGATINFKAYYDKVNIRKAPMPAKPAVLQSCWISEQTDQKSNKNTHLTKKADVKDWLYREGWKQTTITADAALEDVQPVLIIGACEQADALVKHCRTHAIQYQQVVWDVKTSASELISLDSFNPDVAALYEHLQERDCLPRSSVLFVPEYQEGRCPEEVLRPVLSIIIKLAQNDKLNRKLKQWTTVVQGVSDLFCEVTQPYYASLIGICRSIGQELSHINMQVLDQPYEARYTNDIAPLLEVILSPDVNDLVLLRDKRFWVVDYQTVKSIESGKQISNNTLQKGGVYLVTGGLGDVASIYVDYLLKHWDATVVLTGRSKLPAKDKWHAIVTEQPQSDIAKRLARLINWQSQGQQVEYYQGDITDIDAMTTVCQSVQQQLGSICAIVHIAGVSSDLHYKPLSELSWEHCWKIFNPKLSGLRVIEQLTAIFAIDSCLVVSSISSALTGLALGAYGASHNALDAMVNLHANWKLINWDAFNFHMSDERTSTNSFGSGINQLSMTVDEASKALQLSLQQPQAQRIIVSTSALPSRAQFWANRGYVKHEQDEIEVKNPRPQLRNNYIQASNELEARIVKLWESLLGIEPIGIYDNFFELGGHSLLTLELVSRLQRNFGYEGSVIDMFETATITELAQAVAMKQKSEPDDRFNKAKNRALKQKQVLRKLNSKN